MRLSDEELAVEGLCGWFLQVIDLFDLRENVSLSALLFHFMLSAFKTQEHTNLYV